MLYRGLKHEAIAECFRSERARTARFLNIVQNEPRYKANSRRKFGSLCFLSRKQINFSTYKVK